MPTEENTSSELHNYPNITNRNQLSTESDRNTPGCNSAFKEPDSLRENLNSSNRAMQPPPPPLLHVNDYAPSKRHPIDSLSTSHDT